MARLTTTLWTWRPRLVDRSLLRSTRDATESRLEMLETIREYAAERLVESTEAPEVRARHAAYYRSIAEPMEFLMMDPRRDEILEGLERELPNIRAAIAWSLETSDPATGLIIVIALHDYWHIRDHVGEARRALDDLLDASASDGATPLRAKATQVAAELAAWVADVAIGLELAERAVTLAEEAGDQRTLMFAHMAAGWTTVSHQPERAVVHFDSVIALARELGDDRTLAVALGGQSAALIRLRDLDRAATVTNEAIGIASRIGDTYNAAYAQTSLAMIALLRGDLDDAERGFGEVTRASTEAGAHLMMLLGMDGLATVALERGQLQKGARLAAASDGAAHVNRWRANIGHGGARAGAGSRSAPYGSDRVRAGSWRRPSNDHGAGDSRGDFRPFLVADDLGSTFTPINC